MTTRAAIKALEQHDGGCRRCREAIVAPDLFQRCREGQALAHDLNEARRGYARRLESAPQ